MSADVVAASIAAAAALGAAWIGSRGAASTGRRLDAHGEMLTILVTGQQDIDRRLDGVELTQVTCAQCPSAGIPPVPRPRPAT